MSNASMGAAFERQFCELLKERGFWALRVPKNVGGQQPADVIAVKGGYHALIDCKVVSTNRGFPFSHIEDNQWESMQMFCDRGGGIGAWFAFLLPDGEIRMTSFHDISRAVKEGQMRLTLTQLSYTEEGYTKSFDAWLFDEVDRWK